MRPNGQAQSTCFNVLKEHVAGAAFHRETIILVPRLAVVHPHIGACDVLAIGIESSKVVDIVAWVVRASIHDVRVADLQAIHSIEPSGPIR